MLNGLAFATDIEKRTVSKKQNVQNSPLARVITIMIAPARNKRKNPRPYLFWAYELLPGSFFQATPVPLQTSHGTSV
jgi:hypothetical protein